MNNERVYRMPFSQVYPLYIAKAERKGRTKDEVDQIIFWLTGYNAEGLAAQIQRAVDLETFFAEAPRYNPQAGTVTGVICGVRVETIEDPLIRKVRVLDKLIDELAKGKKLDKILRL